MQDANGKFDLIWAAKYLGVSPHTVRAWTRERRLPFFRCGRRIVFEKADLDEFLAKCRVSPREQR